MLDGHKRYIYVRNNIALVLPIPELPINVIDVDMCSSLFNGVDLIYSLCFDKVLCMNKNKLLGMIVYCL
jgi:hypothetical protein